MKKTLVFALACSLFATLFALPAEAQCTATETAMMTAGDGAAGDQFGISIAVDGDTAVVGAWLDDNAAGTNAGAAYVYQRDQGGPDAWGEVVKLTAPGTRGAADDAFGFSVAISGDTIVVGSFRDDTVAFDAGVAYVYERNVPTPDAWGLTKTLTDPGGGSDDSFGWSVSIDLDTIVVGARRKDVDATEDGAAFVFGRDVGGAGNWGPVKQLDASDGASGDLFGQSVGVQGDTVVVGAYRVDDLVVGIDSGAAYVYERDLGGADNWGEVKKLQGGDRAMDDAFGFAVSIDVDTIVVGAYSHDHAGLESGGAYVFDRGLGGPNNWGEVIELQGSGTNARDWFGYSVSADGDRIAVGAYKDFGLAFESGAVYVFERDWGGANAWSEAHLLLASDGETGDRFGYSVGVQADTAVVGAIFNDPAGTNSGMGYVFDLASAPVTYCTAGTSASGCQALIVAAGTPSASATSGFTLSVSGAEGLKNGIFFFGTNGRQANPWGNGTSRQCVVPPVFRTPITAGTGTNGACDGFLAIDMNATWCSSCALPLKNPGVGALVQAQLWYRDPLNTSNQTTSLSNAVEFTVCP